MALILAVLSAVAVVAGVFLIYVPAGVIAAGLVGLCAAYTLRYAQKVG